MCGTKVFVFFLNEKTQDRKQISQQNVQQKTWEQELVQ